MTLRSLAFLAACAIGLAGCDSNSPTDPSPNNPTNPSNVPATQSPIADAQVSSLRPTLIVVNASGGSGARTYEFQISDNKNFPNGGSTVTSLNGAYVTNMGRTGIAEGSGGTTSFVVDADLQPATRFYWRSRATQGGATSEWSPVTSFKSRIVGFNLPGALYDPMLLGETIGVPVGSLSVVPGKGIVVNDQFAYIRYLLPQVLSTGEFSVDVEGLFPNAPESKLKLFSMMDGTGSLFHSDWLVSVQYRGGDGTNDLGNPDNCISWKAVYGDPDDFQYEPDRAERTAGVRHLNPAVTYHWKATWTNEFRVQVFEGGETGPMIYNFGKSTGSRRYTPPQHYVYIGANNKTTGEEDASRPGAIYRNLWVGSGPRPATLGSALKPE